MLEVAQLRAISMCINRQEDRHCSYNRTNLPDGTTSHNVGVAILGGVLFIKLYRQLKGIALARD